MIRFISSIGFGYLDGSPRIFFSKSSNLPNIIGNAMETAELARVKTSIKRINHFSLFH
jgi:hypothetical protein